MFSALRIAHINTEKTWRGGEQQVFSLIQGLEAKGHFNLAVVKKGGALQDRLKETSAQVYEVSPFGEWDFITAYFLNRKLKMEKIDVVHAHSGHGVALGALATWRTCIPLVVTRRVDFHLSRNPFSRWKYYRAKRILAISNKVRAILRTDGIPEKNLDLVPSGVDFKRVENLKPLTKAVLGLPQDGVLVGQVAALAPHKDQATFLKAIALLKNQIPNVHAVLVGEGELRNDLERLRKELRLESHVHFLGFRKDALPVLASFDVFCLSSKEEGLGSSLLDAMALRIPVVATCVGGIPELIENGVTGTLVKPQDPESMAQALASVLGSKKDGEILCDQAFKKAQLYDVSRTVDLTENVYFQLLSPPSPAS